MGSCFGIQTMNRKKPWSDLPPELLSEIAGKLAGFLEHLSFRGVCQQWRLASSEASAELQSEIDTKPWFLLYGNGSHCSLLDSSDKVYDIHMPELDGATCIASKDGWLLLHRNESLFFYRPFSHAMIELPKFPTQQSFDDYVVATFSSTLASPDCMVFVATRTTSTDWVLNVLQKGSDEWVQHEVTTEVPDLKFTFITLCTGGELNFVSRTHNVVFVVEQKTWRHCIFVPHGSPGAIPRPWKDMKPKVELKQKLGLKESDSLTVCGADIIGNHNNTCISNEEIKAVEVEGVDIRRNKGVWINPQFFQLPPNQNSWSL